MHNVMQYLLFTSMWLTACASTANDQTAPSAFANGHQWAVSNPEWVEPVAPFRIIDNIYYVGSKELASFLITSPDNQHILIDGGLPQNASLITANVKALGYDIRDVEVLLNTHAHLDHSGGLAALKAESGASVWASDGDRAALEGGFSLGSEDDENYSAPPVAVDHIVSDGQVLIVGTTEITAILTPGHTRGCTSWQLTASIDEFDYDVLIFCSASVAGNRLVPPLQYESIVEDYRNTFGKLRHLAPDILLANHSVFYDMEMKRRALEAGNLRAFVKPGELRSLTDRLEKNFERDLAAQQTAE